MWAACLLAGYGVGLRAWGADARGLSGRREQVAQMLEKAHRTELALRADCLVAERRLLAAQAVGDQPDWSILLALLARRTGGEVVLRQFELIGDGGRTNSQPRTTDQPQPSLRLAGFGRTQESLSSFLLSLEDTRLFQEVKLVRSAREPLLGTEVVAFEVMCALSLAEDSL